MDEYSRILIEEYCRDHKRTKKSSFLSNLLESSYTMGCGLGDYEALKLEQYIYREKDSELKEALVDLDEFLFG